MANLIRSIQRNRSRREGTLFGHRESQPARREAKYSRDTEQPASQTGGDSAAEGPREGAAAEATGVAGAPLQQRDHRHSKCSYGDGLRGSKSSRFSRKSIRHAQLWRSDSRRWRVFRSRHKQRQSSSTNRFSPRRRRGKHSKRAWRVGSRSLRSSSRMWLL